MPLPEISLQSYRYTVGHYASDWRDEKFDLDAPYQRGSVWTVEQRQALIKSLLMGIPVGTVIIAVQPYGADAHYRVVDGKQRVETIQLFVRGEFPIPSEWVEWERVREECRHQVADSGLVYFAELDDRFRRTFENKPFPSEEFKPGEEYLGRKDGNPVYRSRTAEESLAFEAMVYGLVNSGGTPQDEADLARAATIATS
jgi:hypothetical protein